MGMGTLACPLVAQHHLEHLGPLATLPPVLCYPLDHLQPEAPAPLPSLALATLQALVQPCRLWRPLSPVQSPAQSPARSLVPSLRSPGPHLARPCR